MLFIRPVSFCFRLFLISAAILVAVAVPTNHTLHEPTEDLCAVDASDPPKVENIRDLQNRGHCHYKVCDDKFGNKNGKTRIPDVIYRIVCKETEYCKQLYLTVEAVYYTNGTLTRKRNETVPTGCLYSKGDLRDSITVEMTEPFAVS
jgi:hypothetical protein